MKNRLQKLAGYFVVCGGLLLSTQLLAQAPPPPPDPQDPAPAVPIDGGASLLAVAGIGYGIKKYRDNHKKT